MFGLDVLVVWFVSCHSFVQVIIATFWPFVKKIAIIFCVIIAFT
jgi:hypothetical protein